MALCPCSSGVDYGSCCEPILEGVRRALTPEVLMRSRYTAFVKHRLSYLENSLHPKMRHKHDPKSTREWSLQSEWLGLRVLGTEGGGPGDTKGTVEFVARYKSGDNEVEHHERAEFRRDGNEWYFWDGKVIGEGPIERDEPRVGRNDPCPCGSGKKYKKCCGR